MKKILANWDTITDSEKFETVERLTAPMVTLAREVKDLEGIFTGLQAKNLENLFKKYASNVLQIKAAMFALVKREPGLKTVIATLVNAQPGFKQLLEAVGIVKASIQKTVHDLTALTPSFEKLFSNHQQLLGNLAKEAGIKHASVHLKNLPTRLPLSEVSGDFTGAVIKSFTVLTPDLVEVETSKGCICGSKHDLLPAFIEKCASSLFFAAIKKEIGLRPTYDEGTDKTYDTESGIDPTAKPEQVSEHPKEKAIKKEMAKQQDRSIKKELERLPKPTETK